MTPYACVLADTVRCEGQTNMECFACGQPICRNCSVVVRRWYFWRNKRVCHSCLDDNDRGKLARNHRRRLDA